MGVLKFLDDAVDFVVRAVRRNSRKYTKEENRLLHQHWPSPLNNGLDCFYCHLPRARWPETDACTGHPDRPFEGNRR